MVSVRVLKKELLRRVRDRAFAVARIRGFRRSRRFAIRKLTPRLIVAAAVLIIGGFLLSLALRPSNPAGALIAVDPSTIPACAGNSECFAFTIDTSLTSTGATTGTATTFSIPTSGYVNQTATWAYNWIVNCGDNVIGDRIMSGSSSTTTTPGVNGILCDYGSTGSNTGAGQYQITIRPNGTAASGWMNAFGFYTNTTGANVQTNKDMFLSIDTPLTNLMRTGAAATTYRFANIFYGARNAIGIPDNLFTNISTSGVATFNSMFNSTFYNYAYNSTTATIPAGLFDSIKTGSGTNFSYTFYQTFSYYAYNSKVATIPADLFKYVDTSNGTTFANMFQNTFTQYAHNSTVGTIPAGLFNSINTVKNNGDLTSLFNNTFSGYAYVSTIGTIPAGLFNSIKASSGTNLNFSTMFNNTFNNYAYNSTVATIPAGLFNSIDTTNGTTFTSMFNGTFNLYGYNSVAGTVPANLFGSIKTGNATASTLASTFNNTVTNYARRVATFSVNGSIIATTPVFQSPYATKNTTTDNTPNTNPTVNPGDVVVPTYDGTVRSIDAPTGIYTGYTWYTCPDSVYVATGGCTQADATVPISFPAQPWTPTTPTEVGNVMYYSKLSISISSITPNQGPVTGGTNVTITGSGFKQNLVWKQISAGTSTSNVSTTCGIAGTVGTDANDQAYCWGANTMGQIGNNTTADSSLPIRISGGAIPGSPLDASLVVKQINAGANATCALAGTAGTDANDQLYCWGLNNLGQLGDGTTTASQLPIKVSGGAIANSPLTSNLIIKQAMVGSITTCAIAGTAGTDANDQLYCWGQNNYGQIGNGASGTTANSLPIQISGGAIASSPLVSGLLVKQVFPGNTTCALAGTAGTDANDQLYCWGLNSVGQMGNGTTSSTNPNSLPVKISGGAISSSPLTSSLVIKEISNGNCAIAGTAGTDASDQLYCWGSNNYGEIGNGQGGNAIYNSSLPIKVSGGAISGSPLTSSLIVKQLAGHSTTRCAIAGTVGTNANDQLYCWGYNSIGQIGNGTTNTTANTRPIQISGGAIVSSPLISGLIVKQISSEGNTTCAIAGSLGTDADNQAFCWGNNLHGELGNGTSGTANSSSLPRAVAPALPPPPTVILDLNGTPAPCTNVVVISDTQLTCTTSAHTAGTVDVTVTSGTDSVTLPASFRYFVPIVISSITPNHGPEIGGTNLTITGSGFQQDLVWKNVAVGYNFTCAIASGDQLYCWGNNYRGQLGNGTTTGSAVANSLPIKISGGAIAGSPLSASLIIKQVSVSAVNSATACAIVGTAGTDTNDQLYCWGQNDYGQLGNGTSGTANNSSLPIKISGGAISSSPLDASLVVKYVSTNVGTTCAIAGTAGTDTNDQLYCWGQNDYGQLGNGTSGTANNSSLPIKISGGAIAGSPLDTSSVVRDVSVSQTNTCAIAGTAGTNANDQVYCWGSSGYGQLGNGTSGTATNTLPIKISGGVIANSPLDANLVVKKILSSSNYTCAIAGTAGTDASDQLYCWGYNYYGQLGNGTSGTATNTLPIKISGGAIAGSPLTSGWTIKQISNRGSTVCAIASNGQLYCWGSNSSGQFGNGISGTATNTLPIKISGGAIAGSLLNASLVIRQVSNNSSTTCAIASDGKIYCWGANTSGQFGDGGTTSSNLPVTVASMPPPTPIVTLDINGTPAPCINVVLVSDTKLTCTTTAHVPGLVSVTVGNGIDSTTMPAVWNNGKDDTTGAVADIGSGFLYEALYVSLAVDSNTVNLGTLSPNSAGVFGSSSNLATVRTNYSAGYTLTISTDQPSSNPNASDMKHTTLSQYIASTTNTCVWNSTTNVLADTTTPISNNTWGFTINAANPALQRFCRVPNLNNPLTVKKTSVANDTGDAIRFYYGARADITKPPGTYEATIIYTAVGNI